MTSRNHAFSGFHDFARILAEVPEVRLTRGKIKSCLESHKEQFYEIFLLILGHRFFPVARLGGFLRG